MLENPLQTPVSIEEERSVSPTLGMDSIRASIIAGLMGLAITLLCVLVYYRFLGLIANLALIINLILLMGALTMFRFVLTLPGIAGIILTIGLSVDASVLIYERLREELALGKSLKAAVQTAYQKAFSSIFDANVTTLITAAILFWKASGPVKGFAISLTLGILASLFTALIVGRNCLSWFVDTGRIKSISMLHLISSKNINFLGKGFLACMCSLALILAGADVVLRARREEFRGRFSRRRSDHAELAKSNRRRPDPRTPRSQSDWPTLRFRNRPRRQIVISRCARPCTPATRSSTRSDPVHAGRRPSRWKARNVSARWSEASWPGALLSPSASAFSAF